MKNNKINAEEIWPITWTYIRTVVDTLREPFLILDKNLSVISANKTFYTNFQVTPEETENKLIYSLGNGQWNIPKLKVLLEDILPNDTHFENFEVKHDFQNIGYKILLLNARQVFSKAIKIPIILLAMEDVTKEQQLEDKLKEYTTKLTQKTSNLEDRMKELERINRLMVGRELKMIELKNKIKALGGKLDDKNLQS